MHEFPFSLFFLSLYMESEVDYLARTGVDSGVVMLYGYGSTGAGAGV